MPPVIPFVALPPDFRCELVALELTDTQMSLTLATVTPEAICPRCQVASRRVHSRYERHLWDLPVGPRSVCLHLHLRKFRCDNHACPQTIFAERLSPWSQPYARRTRRLNEDLTALGCENGGEGGARLARRLRLGTWSPNVLLRLTRRLSDPVTETPRVLGIDDWAKRKGQTYGTILCDLERHQIIELLADREADTVAAWLQAHPGVEIICRDRGGAYADGARRGAPQAVQVADRFHLLVNVSEAVQRVVDRYRDQLSVQVLQLVSEAPAQPINAKPSSKSQGLPRAVPRRSQIFAQKELKRRQRAERWEQARALIAQGLSRQAVCRQLRIGKGTLRRVLQTEGCPAHAALWRTLSDFTDEVTRRWEAGERNGRALYNQIRAQGYRGSYQLLLRFLQPLRQQLLEASRAGVSLSTLPVVESATPTVRTITRRLLPRLVTRCLAGNPPADSDEDQRQVAELCQTIPDLAEARELATNFRTLLTGHELQKLAPWLQQAAASHLVEFQALATSLVRDQAAVEQAIATKWSSGQVEGQVNRLKLMKRMMYGRGKLDLLRKRVIYRPATIT
ncbi:MAG: ISL3 family transposase [Anaerolineales bacterium]|nr:ISL3 family transposase [Anaerolineales bacterium]